MSQKQKSDAMEDVPISKYTQNDSLHTDESWFDEKTVDVYFIVDSEGKDEPTRIPAHKSKLASKSEVFDAMFFGDMAEKGDVRMVDGSVGTFKMFLRFFYDCYVELTMENINDVTNMCNKYNVIHGLEECDKFLRSIISHDNIVDVYGLAITFERRKLKRICEARIKASPLDVFHCNSFLECKKFVLSDILDLNLLSCKEVDIFEACISWTKGASGLEELTKEAFAEHFGDLLYKIRFAAMNPTDFANLSRRYGCLIPADDHREIEKALLSGGSFEATNFCKEIRQSRWSKEAIIECNRLVEMGVNYISSDPIFSPRTTFSSSEPLLLGELLIKLEYLKSNMRDIPGIMVLVEEANRPDMSEGTLKNVLKVVPETSDTLSKIVLPKPVVIRPDIYYTICLTDMGPPAHKFFKYSQLKKEVKLEDEVTLTFEDESSPFNDSYGFIPVLRFNRL